MSQGGEAKSGSSGTDQSEESLYVYEGTDQPLVCVFVCVRVGVYVGGWEAR